MKYFFLIVLVLITGCTQKQKYVTKVYDTPGAKKATQKRYSVNGKMYKPKLSVPLGWIQRGYASWYGPNFHGKYTSSGEKYNMYAYTAAHKTLPMDTMVKVVNLNNGKSVIVRINDRGPFVNNRIIDLSYAAAKQISLDRTGVAPVRITVIGFKGKNYIKGYMIQVGAFINRQGALRLAEKYKNLGYNTKILRSGNFYKVYITGFENLNSAKEFKLKNKISGFIVGE